MFVEALKYDTKSFNFSKEFYASIHPIQYIPLTEDRTSLATLPASSYILVYNPNPLSIRVKKTEKTFLVDTLTEYEEYAQSDIGFASPHERFHSRVKNIDLFKDMATLEGMPLQAWSHTTFNIIASKWGELVYMDESTASNRYSMRLCVKTRVHHLISESFKVTLEEKVSVVRAKEVTKWVPDFGVDDIAQSEDGSDNNSDGIHKWGEENDDEVIPDSFQIGTIESVPKNMSHGVSKHDHVNSLAPSPKPINGFSILERFQEFIAQRVVDQMVSYVFGTKRSFKRGEFIVLIIACVLKVVVMGDVNEMCFASEQHGSTFCASNAAEFNTFIIYSHLIDVPLAKVKWAIEGDENSKFSHGIVNKKRRRQAIKGSLLDGEWIDNPTRIKSEFYNHFANIFFAPDWSRFLMECILSRRLGVDSSHDLKGDISVDEIKKGVGEDVSNTVKEYFNLSIFPNDPNRLSLVIDELISHGQSTFIKGRQILNGPLILNEIVSWSKSRKEQALLFKVDFQKAFNSVRWDHLDDILRDPLSPFLFILVMESFNVAFQRVIDRCMFVPIFVGKHELVPISLLFYADDAIFIAPDRVLSHLERLLNSFFLGAEMDERKMTWVCWHNVMAQKQYGGLRVSSLYALNRALLFKWIWPFLSSQSGLWRNVIKVIHGSNGSLDQPPPTCTGCSIWITIHKAVASLKSKGVDPLGFCKK
ncbi:hypothetical protein Tco_0770911 [Tanacetum coccineum]|uniref:Reverse transcriptase domain-containing protein n=1 Tax=Tanacetum coccineum TaxID=301880 RepID=A0ABQ4ZDT9_9ASTR